MVAPWILLVVGGVATVSLLGAGAYAASKLYQARARLLESRLAQAEATAREAEAQALAIQEAANEVIDREEEFERLGNLSPTEQLAGLLGHNAEAQTDPEAEAGSPAS